MNVKNILFFVSGLAVGTAGGILGTKKYFENKYQKRYEEDHDQLEEYYHRRDEYVREELKDIEDEFDDDGVNPTIEGDSVPGGRMTPEERATIKEKLKKNWEGTTNYAGMYRQKNGHTEHGLAEKEHPHDQGEDGEEDPEDIVPECHNCSKFDPVNNYCNLIEESVGRHDSCSDFEEAIDPDYDKIDNTPEEQIFDEHQKNKDRQPKILSADAFSELDASIETEVLYFYALDEMLCDDNEEPIEEPERLVGDCLDKYNFRDNDEQMIFVMNYALDTAYEIQKINSSWTDTH